MVEKLYEFLDGKSYTLDGISGKLIWSGDNKIFHEADENGRKSEKYMEVKRILGDNFVTDLSDSFDMEKWSGFRFIHIAYADLGYGK